MRNFKAILKRDNQTCLRKWVKEEPQVLNEIDNIGDTLLIFAVLNSSLETVAMLLELGADVNLPGGDGRTALFYAVLTDNEPVAQMLHDNGADWRLCRGLIKLLFDLRRSEIAAKYSRFYDADTLAECEKLKATQTY